MRAVFGFIVALVVVGALAAATTAHARAFRQTYGATVPVEGGGCVWNLNQDYFVPRHCDSCRYDLFSACKKGHTISPACKHLHPVYAGYCTPFGECRYYWRDHVYKTYCGCTPQRCYHGPWKLDKCRKHCFALRPEHLCGDGCSGGGGSRLAPWWGEQSATCGESFGGPATGDALWLPNVETMEVESLGYIPALPRASGGGMGGGGGFSAAAPSMPTLPGLPAPGGGPLSFPTSSGPMALPPDSTY